MRRVYFVEDRAPGARWGRLGDETFPTLGQARGALDTKVRTFLTSEDAGHRFRIRGRWVYKGSRFSYIGPVWKVVVSVHMQRRTDDNGTTRCLGDAKAVRRGR